MEALKVNAKEGPAAAATDRRQVRPDGTTDAILPSVTKITFDNTWYIRHFTRFVNRFFGMAVFVDERDEMKKSKRSADWQDHDGEAGEELRLDLDEADEDDILELDDVLELPEEESSLDEEMAEADEDIDLNDLRLDFTARDKGPAEDPLIAALTFAESRPKTADPARSDTAVEAIAQQEAEDFSIGFDESSFLLLDQEVKPGTAGAAVEPPAEKTVEEVEEVGPKAAIEDLVQQIENRLIEAVQQVVEAKLPDIVRTLLQEEIERVKKELGAD